MLEKEISNIDWDKIIFGGDMIPQREVVISDSAYYAQPSRKTVFIYGKYHYIYNKANKAEELYDIEWDPNQHFNLMQDTCFDPDRKVTNISRELYFYPYWDELPAIREKLRKEKNSIWREEDISQKAFTKIVGIIKKNDAIRKFFIKIYRTLFNK